MKSLGTSHSHSISIDKNSQFKQVLDNLLDGVYFTDCERRITYWNQAAEHLSGYLAKEVVGRSCDDNFLMDVDEAGCLLCAGACPVQRALTNGRPHRAEIYLRHKSGHRVPVEVRVSPIQDENGEIVGAVEIFNDNSRQRALRERAKELAKLAFLDAASQLGNRRYLEQQLSQQFEQYSKSGTHFGIIIADLDQLKKINDKYGHATGNAALLSVAKTLSGCLRASDAVGRWGGDEFVAILPGITRKTLAYASEKCRTLVARSTVPVNGLKIPVTVSVGAAVATPGDSPDTLFKRADKCLYTSKQSDRNRVSLS
jgi:diguanylate cyclase (GGDEF)-like protein/PAS domain S-box-containing protein